MTRPKGPEKLSFFSGKVFSGKFDIFFKGNGSSFAFCNFS
jgi:hypothetical protein